MSKPRLVLFDGNAIVHRAFHALPPLTITRTGELVGAVFGFASMILKSVSELKPSHYAIAFDKKGPTFRHILYDQYKAHRPATPEDLVGQFGRVRQLVSALNMPVFELDEYEADDLLGALSCQAAKEGIETVIVTGDADVMQLVGPQVKVLYPKGRGSFTDTMLYDDKAVAEKFGVAPAAIADLKALKGDPSDNIPGVPGIGGKTAAKLIGEFGSIENIYEHLDEVKPERLQNLLREQKEAAFRSKELATIVTDLPVSLDLEEASLGRFDRQQVAEFFREMEFSSLLPRLDALASVSPVKEAPQPLPVVKKDYCIVDTPQALEKLAQRLSKLESFTFDTETTSLNPMQAELVGISISFKAGEAYYIPVAPSGGSGAQLALEAPSDEKRLPLDMVAAVLGRHLADAKITKTAHNGKYDATVLAEHGMDVANLSFDTMVAAYLLGEASLSLKNLAFSHIGLEMTEITELIGTGKKQISMAQVPVARVADYACADADITGQLAVHFEKELDKYELTSLFCDVEMPLVPVLMRMERNGIALDSKLLEDISRRLNEQIQQLEDEICSTAGKRFNINSPQQLGTVLFEEMRLPSLRKTKSGNSTDASVLEELRSRYPIAGLILEYRTLCKLKSTYVDVFPRLVNPKTERVHTSFNQTRTATGRLSSSDPNLQNIPVRGDLARQIRQAFIAPKGSRLLAADYSQIDLRVLAHLCGDRGLIEAFKKDEDIHLATAMRLYGVEAKDVQKEMRRLAKVVNFGVIYGMSSFGLEQATELSREEAHRFITTYFEQHPGVTNYLEQTEKQARERGYVATLLGRRRYIPEINATNRMVRESAERMAINMPIQGTSADIIKVAMVRLQEEMDKRCLKSKMLLQVHDELIFEVPEDEMEEMSCLVPKTMEAAVNLAVPLKVDIKIGSNWGEME